MLNLQFISQWLNGVAALEISTGLAPWLVILAVMVYGLVHSWLASLGFKARTHRWLGSFSERVYRLVYNIFAGLTLLPVLALPAILPDRDIYTIPFPWALLTLAIQGLAGLALIAGLLQTGIWSFLGLRQLVSPAGEQPSQLVISGLYRWVRHPLYTAGLIFIWLTPRMTYNSLALILGLSIYLVIGALFEERKLVEEYGEAYERYRQNTPMLIPDLTRRHSPDW
jgi:protein-S-isoprenylcysteine O-methyltransferase Ste14